MASPNTIHQAGFVKRIFSTKSPDVRKSMLQTSNADIIKAISEILLNIYHGNLTISRQEVNKLKKSKCTLLKIINKRTSSNVHKQLLIKHSQCFVGSIGQVFKLKKSKCTLLKIINKKIPRNVTIAY